MGGIGVKVVVMGLDGACWRLLDPWIAGGELPHLAKLRQCSLWGDLISQLPPVTCPNWKCYSTGQNPGKLGVYWWQMIDRDRRKIKIPNSLSFHGKDYWEYLSKNGKRVAVINMPTTFPPSPVNGYFISGHPIPDAENQNYTYPVSLKQKLYQRYNYRIYSQSKVCRKSTLETPEIQDTLRLIDVRFKTAYDLLVEHDLDFVHVTTFDINVLQHFFWSGEQTLEGWKRIDQHIQRFVDLGVVLILMSDHGSAPIDFTFNINVWLQKHGYLRIHKDKLKDWQFVSHAQPGKEELIDWENSQAVATSQGPVYILKHPSQPDYEKLRQELMRKLSEVKNPNTGEPIAERVYLREELYHGPYLDQAPDLLVQFRDGYDIKDRMDGIELFTQPQHWRAGNARNGMWVLYDPNASYSPTKIEGVNIIDLAPTILELFNLSKPENMDGQSIFDKF